MTATSAVASTAPLPAQPSPVSPPSDRALLIRAEQIKAAYEPMPHKSFGAVVAGLVLVAGMWHEVAAATLALWLAALCAAAGCSLVLYAAYHRSAPSIDQAGKWGRWRVIAALCFGCAFGSAGIVMFQPELTSHQMMLTIFLFVIMCVGGLTVYTTFLPLVYAFAVPTIAPVLVMSATQGDSAHLFIAVGGFFTLGGVLYFATSLNRVMAELIILRLDSLQRLRENERLVEALQRERHEAATARDRAEEANRAKSRFLAAASHDLRQPLHALGLFVAQLRDGRAPAEQAPVVARIETAVGSMNELFNALLDIARLDAGVLAANRTAFPIAQLMRRIEATFAEPAREKGLRLLMPPATAWISSDTVLLERVLLNLVSNAVRYTDRGGVLVGCRTRGGLLRIEVCDTGRGIPESQRQKIFGEFYQVAEAEQERRGGLGLGLAIVDRLCRLLEHPLELTSTVGRGSRFAVVVPLAAAPTKVVAPAPLVAADAPSGKLVLVIDDDALVLEGMRGLLHGWGCNVVTAPSEDAALAGLVGRRPDLIISDSRLADGIAGTGVIARLRGSFGAAIPAFLISGDTGPERLREARLSGHHLLHKPVHPMMLRAMLGQLLKAESEGAHEEAVLPP